MTAPAYGELLATLGILLLQRSNSDRRFTLPCPAPQWLAHFHAALPGDSLEPGAIFPFLDHFLDDAATFWAAGAAGESRSGIWAESAPDGGDWHFEATACRVGDADFLLVQRLATGFEKMQQLFQKGRELSLTHERMVSELGKKEILVHCVVHDMSGPLTSMQGSLQIAQREVHSEGARTMIDLGLIAARRQANLIDDLLDTFRAEMMTPEAIAADPATAPDVVACARAVVAMLQPAFNVRGVKGLVTATGELASVRVLAETSRLERVFHNLLQNAMRHSPGGSTVNVAIRAEPDGFVRISVEDEGAGVPPEVVPQLFQKFVRRGKARGKAGLGLFFCRITVEQWGGSIGCEPRPGGGTAFWFRLRRI